MHDDLLLLQPCLAACSASLIHPVVAGNRCVWQGYVCPVEQAELFHNAQGTPVVAGIDCVWQGYVCPVEQAEVMHTAHGALCLGASTEFECAQHSRQASPCRVGWQR